MVKTDGIIFDIDGTLWDTTGVVADAWNEAVRVTGYTDRRVVPEELKGLFGRKMEEIMLALFPEVSEEGRLRLLRECSEREQKYLRDDPCEGIAYPGIWETMRSLSGRYPLFIVSNCQKGYIELVCGKLDIAGFIKDSECYGNTMKGKAENLRALCLRNDLKHPVYVGDTDGDRAACEEAGVPFIFAAYGFGEAKDCAARVEAFEDLRELFA